MAVKTKYSMLPRIEIKDIFVVHAKKKKYIYIYIHTYIYSDLNGYSRKRDRYITDFQEGKVN